MTGQQDADLLNRQGNAMLGQGRFAEAITAYGSALASVPDFARAMSNMGVAYAQLGRLDDALPWFWKAFDRDPAQLASLQNLVRTLRKLGRTDESLAPLIAFDKAVPGNVPVMTEIAGLLANLGRHETAVDWYRRILECEPGNAATWNHLATALKELGQFETALAHVERAETLAREQTGRPDPASLANRAFILLRCGRREEALDGLLQASSLFPDDPDIGAALGNAYASQDRWAEALDVLDRLDDRIHPLNRVLHAEMLLRCRQLDRALELYDRVVAQHPELLAARYARGVVLLLLGRLTDGWADYEYRRVYLQGDDLDRGFAQPVWKGEPPGMVQGRLLVTTEQGFGDTLQFCRYVPMLTDKGYDVVFEVPEPLRRLMLESLPHPRIRIVPRLNGDRGQVFQSLPFAAHVSLMSLPERFGTTLESICGQPYLSAPPARTALWGDRLVKEGGRNGLVLPGRLRVGLVWAGDPRPDEPLASLTDRRRSLSLDAFAPLANVPDVAWISLQKGPAARHATTPPAGLDLIDVMEQVTDFADTAAIIANLDLVITVDTSVAHLAGAMGVPVWILSRFDGCWRWLLDRDDSPWYRSVRLFRQDAPGAWDEVVRKVARALAEREIEPPSNRAISLP